MSFFEFTKAYPEGSSSASRMAYTAKHLGYAGIIISSRDPERIFMPRAAESIRGIDVTFGAEAHSSSPRALKSRIGSLRSRYNLIIVRGESDETVRMASEDPNVDLLIHPCEPRRTMTIATARQASQNQISIAFDLWPMIHLRAGPRARWLEALRRNLQLVRKFDISPAITAGAVSHLDLRSPRDLMALAEVAGFEPDEAKEALRLTGRILEYRRRNWAAPGVEII